MNQPRNTLYFFHVFLFTALLSACGGGGSSPSPAPLPLPVSTYTIGGMVSGLTGAGLVLQNNGGDNLSVSADGSVTFATPLVNGGSYSVTVATQPAGQTCTVASGAGTVAAANISNVAVTCVATSTGTLPAAPTLALDYGIKQLKFTWNAVSGATHYQLFEDPNGVSGYTQVGSNLTTTAYDHGIALSQRINARYLLKACNNAGCASSSAVFMGANLTAAIGYVKASNTAILDQFGYALTLSGDGATLAMGAPAEDSNATGIDGDQGNNSATNSGAVYVYVRSGNVWAQQAYVKASDTGVNDYFGYALTLSGDGNTLAVGAYGQAMDSGAVYVYTRSGSVWAQQAYVTASNTEAFDYFGASLALSGDGNTLAVGAIGEASNATGIGGDQGNNSFLQAGAVYVYTRSGSVWAQQAYVKASNTFSDGFGYALALSNDGNTLAVGANYEDSNATGIGGDQSDNSAANSGAVYVYTRSASVWVQQAYVKASNTGAGDEFGVSLALSGDGNTLAVGARVESSNATGIDGDQGNNLAPGSGTAYVYTRSGSVWAQQAYVKASNTGDSDNFGWSLTLSDDGNILAVGATMEDSNATGIGGDQGNNTVLSSGAVYVYTRSGSVWMPQSYVKASNTGGEDNFGWSLALSSDGSTLAVGAILEDSNATGIGGDQGNNNAGNSGAVYLY